MKKFRKRIFAAVLAALMLTTAIPGTALYASAETESVSENAIGQEDKGKDDTGETGPENKDDGTGETGDSDTEEPGRDDAEATGDSDTDEPAQEPPAGPLEENTENQEDTGICKHHQEHDAGCGYIPKSEDGEGSPCTYECRICPIEDLIADLPDKVTEDNAEEVRAQLDEILALYRELNEDEQGQIDLSRCYELQEALDNANASMMVAEEIDISQTCNNILTADEGNCPGRTFTGSTAMLTKIYVESGTHNVTFSDLNISLANVGIAPAQR